MERRRYGQQRRNLSSYSSPSSFAGLSSSSSSNSYKNSKVNGSGDSKFRRNSGKVQQLLQQQEVEEEATAIVGTCQFMCPEDEKAQRERLRDLSVFERLHGDPRKSSPGLAVKKFCRTITTKLTRSSDVRPLPVLEDTLNYLLNLLNSTEHPFELVHDFVFDRTRSIRQDLSMQNIVNDKVIRIYEKIVKFHVISHHKLRTGCDNSTISSMLHLNMEQLTKALTSLYHLYEANRGSISTYENEPEFHSLYVLLHLDCNGQAMGESLSLWFRHLPLPIIKSKEMHFARQVLRYFRMGNYRRFLCTTAAEASYLQYCIMEPYIDEVRALALTCINNGGYKLHPYPLSHLSKLLKMEESDVESLCKACGLETCTDEEGNKLLPAKQTTFCRPKGFLGYGLLGLQQLEKKLEAF